MIKKSITAIVTVALALILSLTLGITTFKPINLSFISIASQDVEYQVFYSADSEGFNEHNSVKKWIKAGEQKVDIQIPIHHINRFRLDFGQNPGHLIIKSLVLEGRNKIRFDDYKKFYINDHIEKANKQANLLEIISSKEDPFIVFNGNVSVSARFIPDFVTLTILILVIYPLLNFMGKKIELSVSKNNYRKSIFSLFSLVFITIIVLPFIGNTLFYGLQNNLILKTENRRVSQYKEFIFSKQGVRDYFNNLDKMIEDRLFKKDKIVDTVNYYLSDPDLFFKVDLDKAVIGNNGFVFLGNNYDKVIYRHFNQNKFSIVNNSIDLHKKLSTITSKVGAHYVVFVAPDKHAIYAENFPSWAKVDSNEGVSKLTQKKIQELQTLGINVVYPYSELKSAKQKRTLYYKTDTHWNIAGAEVGFMSLMKNLESNYFTDFQFQANKDVRLTMNKKDSFGDLGVIAGLSRRFKVDDVSYDFCSQQEVDFSVRGAPPTTVNIRNSSSSGYDGTWFGYVVNNSAPLDKKVLVICDSFMTAMSLFINSYFHQVSYISKSYPQGDLINIEKTILDFKPDIVIYETVERAF